MNRVILVSVGLVICLHFIHGQPCANDDLLENGQPLTKYVPSYMIAAADSFLAGLKGDPDSALLSLASGLNVKDQEYISVDHSQYFAILIGAVGKGEFLLIDSANPSKIWSRVAMNIPGAHAYFGGVKDINGDGIPELRINLSGGAHGYYTYFLSISQDSLRFIRNQEGHYSFFASTGGIELVATEKIDVYDIRIDQEPQKGQTENYKIYKWNGKNYEFKETVIKADK